MTRTKRWVGNGIRVLTLGICVLAIGVGLSRAQVRPPGGIGGTRPPGGISGGGPPGGVAGGIGGMPPGGIGGGIPPGGIGGMPPPPPIGGGIPPGGVAGGIGGMPPPGGIGGMPPPGGIGGGIGGGNIIVWSCERCKATLGTGPTPPAINTCPNCRAQLTGVKFQAGGGFGGMPPPGGMGGGPPPGGMGMGGMPPAGMPPVGGMGGGGMPPADNQPAFNVPPEPDRNTEPARGDAPVSRSRIWLWIGIALGTVVFVMLVAAGLVAIVVFANRDPERPSLKKRKSRDR